MNFIETRLPGVRIVEPEVHRDSRGFFFESYHAEKHARGGILGPFVQDNHSRSGRGTLRGLHSQWRRPQAKLVRVLLGEIFDVAADVRRGSPTFRQWVGVTLSAENFRQLYVPAPGFLHGFVVLSETAEVEYKCTDLYDPGGELSVVWNDRDLAIDWPIQEPIVSAKDAAAPRLADIFERLPVYAGP